MAVVKTREKLQNDTCHLRFVDSELTLRRKIKGKRRPLGMRMAPGERPAVPNSIAEARRRANRQPPEVDFLLPARPALAQPRPIVLRSL